MGLFEYYIIPIQYSCVFTTATNSRNLTNSTPFIRRPQVTSIRSAQLYNHGCQWDCKTVICKTSNQYMATILKFILGYVQVETCRFILSYSSSSKQNCTAPAIAQFRHFDRDTADHWECFLSEDGANGISINCKFLEFFLLPVLSRREGI